MSKLTDILHEIVNLVGRPALHEEVDKLDQETAPKPATTETTPTENQEDTFHAPQ